MSKELPAEVFYRAERYCSEDSVGYLMRRLMLSLINEVDRRLAQHDLTHAQWAPMLRLRFNGPMSSAALARELAMDGGAMTRLLDRLEAKSLVRRERSSEDRRVVNLVLTDEGRAMAAQVPPVLADVLNGHLAGFSDDEWRQLLSFLTRMLANGEAMRAAAPDKE